ncbi:hypothetical protein GTP46_07655 [Duganella sp. FT135W]|uniref:Uncharacterized protein n=1 Tax=Duganella flavida TaxID=2692175 RepID=A0A6L8K555_9BURK|nr:hypothetical protein [Duganella flavida]MYM22516.1 hypothetical protein [Duganella flavida]
MKASTKAALISALIFPGLGHLALQPRRAARGLVFLLPTAAAAFYLLRTTLQLADRILDELNSGALAFDPIAITERIHSAGIDNPATNAASLVCLVCWIAAIADALWLGRRRIDVPTTPRDTP